ncbi:sigma factor-like helix-turn-helix DNA-binding protein [Dactylosporangium sp. CA-139066]|uniref:sigma factor-like helix-turn-helix DNA-binding protein n=1 Tax=Dactylosporangium sp. CA-139066 TaxID=3239930 RepID=UPI003D94417B
MTVTTIRPNLALVSAETAEAPQPTGCTAGVPWCTGNANNHDLDLAREGEPLYHDSAAVDLPLTAGSGEGCDGYTVSLERRDTLDGEIGHTRIYMALLRDGSPSGACGGYATIHEAEQVGRTILGHVATARGLSIAPAVMDELDEHLSRLSSRQMIAMRLRYGFGFTLADIGRILGVGPDRVRVYISRAKQQLRAWGVTVDGSATTAGAA